MQILCKHLSNELILETTSNSLFYALTQITNLSSIIRLSLRILFYLFFMPSISWIHSIFSGLNVTASTEAFLPSCLQYCSGRPIDRSANYIS